ncbi:primase-like DNA-binding domain-containing protein [Lysinibacillus fusiformis]|uniref:primase-like DNA-binding domain-containing protein n=1 Tax=Lysinibacillus fusiformis TaxID=28031 RepID=UPI00382F3AF1
MIGKFISEKIEKNIKSFETSERLYNSYKSFCAVNSIVPLTKIRFSKKLDEFNMGVKHTKMESYIQLYGRQGVRLK